MGTEEMRKATEKDLCKCVLDQAQKLPAILREARVLLEPNQGIFSGRREEQGVSPR